MKQILAFTIAACLVLGLCACGNGADQGETPRDAAPLESTGDPVTQTPEPAAPETPEPTAPSQETQPPAESEAPEASVDADPAPAQPPAPADPKTVAEAYIGQGIAGLYAAIGYPQYSDYAPSCLGEGGEDGNLYYDGFIVYTYRENGVETVSYVE